MTVAIDDRAVLVDWQNNVVDDLRLMGKVMLFPLVPIRETPLDVKRPHRGDVVERVFELDGRAADGAWIYRERYWQTSQCDCQSKGDDR